MGRAKIYPPQAPQPSAIDNDDIGGVVVSAKGPEAGVLIIAEPCELDRPTEPY